ncbi:Pkinase-domain-containing protein [Auriculariales sp. MPI-PUGE-AT-0066]|nr:Pkinase-domain-containing protein [Auriculariales sp. MPI-PUGE-AT-0066]
MNLSFPLLSRLHPLSSHLPSSCSSRAFSSAPLSSGLDFPTAMQTEKLAAAGSLDHDEPRRLGMWVFGETVGKGASGRVRIVQHLRTGRIAAAKIIPMEFIKQSRINIDSLTDKAAKQKLSIEREVLMMKLMDHPNIMRLYDVYEGDDECVMILEFVDGGELFDFLVNKRRLLVPEALNYFRQIISGLNYCHTHHIIHRDLKPENILLTGERLETIKIADWCMLQTSCGSPHYASPEIVCGKHYEGAPSDIWSCGVILFALLSGRLPFDDKDIHVLLRKVKHGQYEMSPQIAHPAAIDLIRRMLIVNPTDRIAMDEILSHPFMHLDAPEITPMLRQPTRISDKESQEAISHIDRDLFRSMCAILRTQIDADEVLAALTQPGRHHLKTIYRLLVQYRNRSMEEYNMTEDYG